MIDGEAVVLSKAGLADFDALRGELDGRSRRLRLQAFDLLSLGVRICDRCRYLSAGRANRHRSPAWRRRSPMSTAWPTIARASSLTPRLSFGFDVESGIRYSADACWNSTLRFARKCAP